MQTHFTAEQRADPAIVRAEQILRKCVHCGMCTATCPTYLVLGDELDSPRGRIVLLKDLLENQRVPTPEVVLHLDRCLSCLSCMTTCPSGVDYMHLIDHGRAYIETHYRRPLADRLLRWFLGFALPRVNLFRALMAASIPLKPLLRLFPGRLGAMSRLVPRHLPGPSYLERSQTIRTPVRPVRKRVVLMTGCVQQVLAPAINEATVRLLVRHGCDVVIAAGSGCCGALPHHLGDAAGSHRLARCNILAWQRAADEAPVDAIVVNTSGCGTTVKDYTAMFADDPALRDAAREMAERAVDVTELMAELGLQSPVAQDLPSVAYHAACSLQHGQRVHRAPRDLLRAAGFEVREVPDSHLCCGSAGTYNLLQPAIAGELGERKAAAIRSTGADIVAAGNLGCLTQIASHGAMPAVHTVELLDWATGGPMPASLADVGWGAVSARLAAE